MGQLKIGDQVEVEYYGNKIPGVFEGTCSYGHGVRVDPNSPEAKAAGYAGAASDLWSPESVTKVS